MSYIAYDPKTSFMELFMWMKSQVDSQNFRTFVALAWSFRNSVVHADLWKNLELGAATFLRLVKEYGSYAAVVIKCLRSSGSCSSRSNWQPSQEGVIRINSDAAMIGDDGVGTGVVIRD